MLMKAVGFMRVIGLQKLLTFGTIRLVSVLMTVHNFSTQYNTEQFPLSLQTTIVSQMLSVEGEWGLSTPRLIS